MQDMLASEILADQKSEAAWGTYATGTLIKKCLQHLWGLYAVGNEDLQINMLRNITRLMIEGLMGKGPAMNAALMKEAFAQLTMEPINKQLLKGETILTD
jgi:hypothetical protein